MARAVGRPPRLSAAEIQARVLYRDGLILVLDKPAGLAVHAWTFRAENHFLPSALRRGDDPAAHGDLAAEIRAFMDAGVDGLFCDHPDLARRALDAAQRQIDTN